MCIRDRLNHVSSEKKLEKLAEFIESAVTKIMKASIKIVAGIGIVQAMICLLYTSRCV